MNYTHISTMHDTHKSQDHRQQQCTMINLVQMYYNVHCNEEIMS